MSGQLPQVPNYLPNIQSPFQSAVQGLQLGQVIGEAKTAEEQRASMQNAMQAFQRNPSSQTLTPLLTSLPPQTAEVLRKHWEGMETSQREGQIAFGGQAMSAILAGRADIAADLFMQRATALENAGRPDEAKFQRDMAELVKTNPQFALSYGAQMLGSSPGGKVMLENILAARGAPTAERGALADVQEKEAKAGVAPIVAGAGAAQAVANAQSAGNPALSEAATVRVNDAFTASDAARTRAGQLNDLASRFSQDTFWSSLAGRGLRGGLELLGFGAGEYSQLVQEFMRMRNLEVAQALKGLAPVTEKEFETVQRGFPGERAGQEAITNYLRAASRVAQYEADYNRFKAMFMDANRGSMGRANRSFEIDGVTIPSGTDMSSAFRRVIGPQIIEQANTQALQDNPRLSRFVQPPAGQ
jgi:hypothetical protein